MAQDAITRLLKTHRPQTVLVIGDFVLPDADFEPTVLARADTQEELAALGRFDFAVVSGLLESREPSEARAVLGRLKNLHTDRFLLIADEGRSCLNREELLALALEPYGALEDGRVTWLYDVDHYNPERSWNNPEDWAHPQNFGKCRW